MRSAFLALACATVVALGAVPAVAHAAIQDWWESDKIYVVVNCPYCEGETHGLKPSVYSIANATVVDSGTQGALPAVSLESLTPDILAVSDIGGGDYEMKPLQPGTARLKLIAANGATSEFTMEVVAVTEEQLPDTLVDPVAHPNPTGLSGITVDNYLVNVVTDPFQNPEGQSMLIGFESFAEKMTYGTAIDSALNAFGSAFSENERVLLSDGQMHTFLGWDTPVDRSAVVSPDDFEFGWTYTNPDSGLTTNNYVITVTAQWDPELAAGPLTAEIQGASHVYLDLAQSVAGEPGGFYELPLAVSGGSGNYSFRPRASEADVVSPSFWDGKPVLGAVSTGTTEFAMEVYDTNDPDNVVTTNMITVTVYDSRVEQSAGPATITNANGATLTFSATSEWNDAATLVTTHLGGEAAQTATNRVVEVVEGVTGHPYVYDIHLEDLLGTEFAVPDGSAVTVTLPIPEGLSAEGLRVFHVADDGTVTDMGATVDAEAGTVSFTTTHFSTFVLANVETPAAAQQAEGLAKTGDVLLPAVALLAVAAAGAGLALAGRRMR